MIERKDISIALPDYVTAANGIAEAWRKLEPLLPAATGKEAEAVAAVQAAVKAHTAALGTLVLAMLMMGKAEPTEPTKV